MKVICKISSDKTGKEQLYPQTKVCAKCGASGKTNCIGIHSRNNSGYTCKDGGKIFTESHGTAL